jgi:hypothetical protein
MARGFNVGVRVRAGEEVDEGSVAAELEANGSLSALEKDGLFPAALDAAHDLIAAFPGGSFEVTISGADNTQKRGEDSFIQVEVRTRYTEGDPETDPNVDAEKPSAFSDLTHGQTIEVEGPDAGKVKDPPEEVNNGEADSATA